MLRRLTVIAAAVCLAPLAVSAATEIVPVSYVFDQSTDCGSFCYYDGSGPTTNVGELTDGAYGVAGWTVNLGNGNAAEWVGWNNKPSVNIDFDFGSVKQIDTLALGTTQDNINDVVLPNLAVYQWTGSGWSFVQSLITPESSLNDKDPASLDPHGFLSLSGLGINSQKIRVTASFSNDGPWTFVDEVDFYAAAVPEPSTWALALAGLAVLGGVARRRLAAA